MYCPKCGTENPDDAQLCSSCSWVLTSISTTALAPDAKTSGLAIAALVLAILSIPTLFITAIPAFICGIVGIFKIEKSAGQLKGKGLAIAGIALPVILLPFILFMAGMTATLIPALGKVRAQARRLVCGTNMSALGKAMLIYANDYDEKYPDTSQWCDLLIEHADVPKLIFRCKGAPEGPCNYAINPNAKPSSHPYMVLLFETYPGWNQAGGPEILTTENHYEGCNVLFVDSHVEFVRTEDLDDLKWTAEQND